MVQEYQCSVPNSGQVLILEVCGCQFARRASVGGCFINIVQANGDTLSST